MRKLVVTLAAFLVAVLTVSLVQSVLSGLGASDGSTIASPPKDLSEVLGPIPEGLQEYYTQVLAWEDCDGGFECANLKVPRIYAEPNSGDVTIAVIRLRTKNPRGSLVLNPGGPGGSGIDYARAATYVTTDAVRKHFDIVGFDPRGVGQSDPIDCLNDKQTDTYIAADGSPDSQAEVDETIQILQVFAEGCATISPDLYAYVDTVSAARDVDILREALGDEKLNWLGKSYGTFLGATYASLFPNNVGRMLLDGAIDPLLTNEQLSKGQALGFEDALDRFLADCPRHEDCPLDPNPKVARQQIERMLTDLDANPAQLEDGRLFTQAYGVTGVVGSLYDKAYSWPEFRLSLADALNGNFEMLAQSVDFYTGRSEDGTYSDNSNDVIAAVNCLDRPDRASVERTEALASEWSKQAPIFGAYLAWSNVGCTYWKAPATGKPEQITAAGSSKILVVGTTHDPATPYVWAQALADMLSSSALLTLDGDGHTAYMQGSQCIDDAVDSYLLSGEATDGITCSDQR